VTLNRRTVAALAAAGAALAAPIGGASAAEISGVCPNQIFTTPFSAWGDTGAYTLVPGGDFEGTLAGWTTSSKKVAIVRDGVDNLGSGADRAALALPAKTSVTGPSVCVTTDYPYMRFFARSAQASSSSTLTVEVLYESGGALSTIRVAQLSGSTMGGWSLTPKLSTGVYLATLGASLGSGTISGAGNMRLRLTASGGDWTVDDIYVDPKMR